MCKKILFIILFTIILLSVIPFIKKGEKQDDTINYLINENIVDNTSFENNIKENLISEENVIQQDIINENKLENDMINDIKEEKKTENNTSFSEEIMINSNKTNNKDSNKNINNNSNKEEIKTQVKKEEIVEEEYKQEDKVEEKTEQKVEQNTKEEIKENTIVQETKYEYVYNYSETQRLRNDIEDIAKGNPDLFDENGNKLYRVSEFSSKEQAMNKTNYFSPYNILEVKGVVQNTYSCTFLVYAIDYKINGIVQQTRYYIKVTEF